MSMDGYGRRHLRVGQGVYGAPGRGGSDNRQGADTGEGVKSTPHSLSAFSSSNSGLPSANASILRETLLRFRIAAPWKKSICQRIHARGELGTTRAGGEHPSGASPHNNKKEMRLTKGIGIMATAMSAKSVFAHWYVRLSYILCVNSGNTAPRRFPVKNLSKIKPRAKPNTLDGANFRGADTYDTCFDLPTQTTRMVRSLTETKEDSPPIMR